MASPLDSLPKRARVVEVGPRDGLQNEAAILSTEDKVRFITLLAEAGFQDIEVSSFVSPKHIPQLADAAEVFAALAQRPNDPTTQRPRFSALVPNRKGMDRALAAGVRAIAFFTAASETFNQRNIGMSIAESLDTFRDLIPEARAAGCWIRAYVSTAFHCPYEGRIIPGQVLPVVEALVGMGIDEISIGDTIGRAVPTEVAQLSEDLVNSAILRPTTTRTRTRTNPQPNDPTTQRPNDPTLAYHFHDTRGTALANVLTALEYGISVFDSSAGGAGGCPFAPGAAGNLATEDLLYMLHGMGIETGVDLDTVVEASRFLESRLGHSLPVRYRQSALNA